MNTDALRTGTRAEHEAVEALMPLMDAGLTREQYAGVLQCMYRAIQPWEEWATAYAPPRFAATANERRRAHLIEADLRFLGIGKPVIDASSDVQRIFDGQRADTATFEAAFLGAMYVVEGSTLGGQYIARHVEERFKLEPGVGDAYFVGYGEQTSVKWRDFKGLLVAQPEDQTDTVIASAKAMFAYFGRALQPCSSSLTASPSPK